MKQVLKFLVVIAIVTVCLVVYFMRTVVSSPEVESLAEVEVLNTSTLSMHDERVLYYKSQIYHPEIRESRRAECTVLMPTYKREKMLPQILNHYCNKLSPLTRIVLIWNDPESPIPPFVLELQEKCDKELKVIPMKENKLTNRLLPQNLEGIETKCKQLK